MTAWQEGRRPITIAIVAMGGEGGGVLSNWIVDMAEDCGYTAQNTSVPGVAQRTGSTVYYVEALPPGDGEADPSRGRSEAVLSTMPSPGEVDIVIASELMEAGRAVQRGFVTPSRTTLIASTHRVYSILERSHLGDGRVDSTELIDAAARAAKLLIADDFMAMAERARSVISASMFGALAGAGVLPFERAAFERAITRSGKAVDRSLEAFAAGFDAAVAARAAAADTRQALTSVPSSSRRSQPREPVPITISTRRPLSPEEDAARREADLVEKALTAPETMVGPKLQSYVARVAQLPQIARPMALLGCQKTAVYQGLAYTDLYLARVERLAALDPGGQSRLAKEAARHIALWMCYQDTIHVALQKTRQTRLERVREEARPGDGQLVQVREFLHPQVEEITDTLPTRLGRRLSRSTWFQRIVHRLTHKGIILNTTSVFGYAVLSTLARMRPIRPRSLRFGREQELIEGWLDLAAAQAVADLDLACETVECARVLKGYGATHEHGSESFRLLMGASRRLQGQPNASASLSALRDAALADEDGTRLRAELAGLSVA